jgi:hypothetical protein
MAELHLPVGRPRHELERKVVTDLERALDGGARNADPDAAKDAALARRFGAKKRELAQLRVAPDEDELLRLLDDPEGQLGEDARGHGVRVSHVQRDVVELRRLELHEVRATRSRGRETPRGVAQASRGA